MIINFASHIYNRAYQLKETLGVNLGFLLSTPHKLVLVDYKSNDDIEQVIEPYLNHPNLVYKKIDEVYHIAVAKNKASLLIGSDYIFNLDCDNFISQELIKFIESNYDKAIFSVGRPNTSHGGRIGLPAIMFKAIGGYPVLKQRMMVEDLGLYKKIKLFYSNHLLHPGMLNCRDAIDNGKNGYSDTDRASMANENQLELANLPETIPKGIIRLKRNRIGGGSKSGGVIKNLLGEFSNQFEYSFRFLKGFDFSQGGKLPGVGFTHSLTTPPYGGCKVTQRDFSARLMWREDGLLELYLYHPVQKGVFGDSIPFHFKAIPGVVYNVSYFISNKTLTVEVNGHKLIVNLPSSQFNTILYHVYRGGGNLTWASNEDGEIELL